MDTKSPDDYDYIEESAEVSIRDTQALIHYIRSLDHHPNDGHKPLVQPILTPRFALSCSRDLLTRLGSLAASDPTLHIQTHISENEREIEETLKRFSEAKSYADVYDTHGLLRENTILAHAIHLTKDEVELIKQRKVGISHCPTSNFNLNSGIAPIGYFLDRGVKVRRAILSLQSFLMKDFFPPLFLGWVRYRCFWWILPFYFKCHPKCQPRG